MQIVYVRWRDAYLNEGWHNEAGIDHIKNEPVWIVESLGWLIDKNDDRLIICGSTSSIGSCSEIMKIPAEAIIDLQILAKPKEPENQNGIDPTLPTLHYETLTNVNDDSTD